MKACSVLPVKVRDGLTKEVTFELNLNACQTHKGYRGIPGKVPAVQMHRSLREHGAYKDIMACVRMVFGTGEPQETPWKYCWAKSEE